jgi:epoxyqueuosine reductase
MTATLSSRIKEEARRLGFELVGVAPLRASDHAAFYRRWLEQGHHGTMDYLARDDAVAARLDPASRWPELRSAIVVGHFYDAAPGTSTVDRPPPTADIARYARGRDYHRVVKKKLLALLHWLENELGEDLPLARAYVDTGPVLERELARRAGLGWFGRNTMLIHPRKGSYFFLGELLLPLELEYDEPFETDRCGSCRACLDACPTGALLGRDADGAPVMNANLCISYLTIEHRGPIPEELRPAMGNHVFGCDVCQEVCPWNGEKRLKVAAEPDYAARGPGQAPHGVGPESSTSARFAGTDSPSLIELLRTALDPDAWDAFSRGSAIRRAGRVGFARNVCVGLGNWGAESAVPVLRSALSDPGPVVRAHAAWALGRVGSPDAASALSARSASEEDASVLEEVRAALDV